MKNKVVHSIVIPVFNEEAVVKEMYARTTSVMKSLNEPYELIFVNDGSRDTTLLRLMELHQHDACVKILNLSRNFGHQVAITAGFDRSTGETVVIIDSDLQDPPEVIVQLIEKWKEGYDVVYAKRIQRKGESFFKKWTAKIFYQFLAKATKVKIPTDTGDFRLLSRKAVDDFKRIREHHRYVRGLVAWLGHKQIGVEYVRDKRYAGVTKYPLRKMIQFAFDGITSFSFLPLRLATYLGFIISFICFLAIAYSILIHFIIPESEIMKGWSTTIIAITLIGGIQLISLGVIGEYIGRIYDEVKNRPLYLLDDEIGFDA